MALPKGVRYFLLLFLSLFSIYVGFSQKSLKNLHFLVIHIVRFLQKKQKKEIIPLKNKNIFLYKILISRILKKKIYLMKPNLFRKDFFT